MCNVVTIFYDIQPEKMSKRTIKIVIRTEIMREREKNKTKLNVNHELEHHLGEAKLSVALTLNVLSSSRTLSHCEGDSSDGIERNEYLISALAGEIWMLLFNNVV